MADIKKKYTIILNVYSYDNIDDSLRQNIVIFKVSWNGYFKLLFNPLAPVLALTIKIIIKKALIKKYIYIKGVNYKKVWIKTRFNYEK